MCTGTEQQIVYLFQGQTMAGVTKHGPATGVTTANQTHLDRPAQQRPLLILGYPRRMPTMLQRRTGARLKRWFVQFLFFFTYQTSSKLGTFLLQYIFFSASWLYVMLSWFILSVWHEMKIHKATEKNNTIDITVHLQEKEFFTAPSKHLLLPTYFAVTSSPSKNSWIDHYWKILILEVMGCILRGERTFDELYFFKLADLSWDHLCFTICYDRHQCNVPKFFSL